MGLYQNIRNIWKKPKENELWKGRLFQWRREESTVKLKRPTRLDRARSLGYRAKQGVIVFRQRVSRGGHKREKIRHGRRPKHFHRYLALRKSYQLIAEERVQKKHKNLVVLNSYYVAEDGKHLWYEVIAVDPENPAIKNDQKLSWTTEKTNLSRVFHGKTMAGKRGRGMKSKGKGFEKARPSRRAHDRRQ